MAARIGSPNFLALVTILTEGVSAAKRNSSGSHDGILENEWFYTYTYKHSHILRESVCERLVMDFLYRQALFH